MTYEEFRGELLKELEEKKEEFGYDEIKYYADGYTSEDPVELSTIRDTNIKYRKVESDILLGDYIILTLKGRFNHLCRFECKYLHDSYNKDGWEGVWAIIRSNLAVCRKYSKHDIMELMEKNDYDLLKEKIFIRLLNFNDHRYEFKDHVYRRTGDMAFVLYLFVSDEHVGERHDVMSIKLPRTMMESWDLSEDEIWDNALTNTYVMSPPRMYLNPMDTYKPPYHRGAFMALNSNITSLSPMAVPTITTTTQMNGAIAMFYPGVMERIAELFRDDYYIAFTSIHDARVHKKGIISPRQILATLKDTNKAFDPSDTLSHKVYLYEAATKKFSQLEL